MASIADLFGRLLLDDSGFETAVMKSAQSAGDKAGQTLGTSLSRSFKTVGFSALSVVFAGLTANTVQLDTAVKQYAADVGASAEESDKAKAAATDLFKTNRQGFDEILQTLGKLRTEQGLSIDEATALADTYLKFAKVAGTTAPTAVKLFDDIQDAWNLTAAQGVALMDELVASNQKYGGSLQQRAADLKALAPALQGLNLNVHDGVALENLFAASGLDASAAQRALNTAVKNLKPGQTFDDLIRSISAIEDPTLRAQKAIEIFGVRGGTALAQAFKPGITSLQDFGVSADAAAGAAKRASDSIDSSIPAQFALFLKNLQGTLVDIAAPAGPIVTAAASLLQLGLAAKTAGVGSGILSAAQAALGISSTAAAAGATLEAAAVTTAAVQTELFTATAIAGVPQLELFTAAEIGAAGGATALGTAAGTAAAGGLAALLTGLKVVVASAAASAPVFQLGGQITHQFAVETAEADFKTRSFAEAQQRLKDAVGFGSLTQAEADAILAKYTTTVDDAYTGVGHMTQGMDESARAALTAAGAEQAHADSIAAATTKADDYAAALKRIRDAHEADKVSAAAAVTVSIEEAIAKSRAADAIKKYDTQAGEDIDWMHKQAQKARELAGEYNGLTVAAMMAAGAIFAGAKTHTQEGMPGSGATGPSGQTDPNALIEYLENIRQQGLRADQAAKDRLAKAKTDAADYARTVEGQMRASFAAQKTAVDAFFDALHKRRLDDIEVARKAANDALEIRKKGLFAEVDAEQAALDARHKAEQRQGLVASVQQAALAIPAAGDDPKAILSAVQQLRAAQAALRDFDEQARIDAERATAQTAADAIDAQIQANDAKAAAAVEGENATSAARKKAFDDGLVKLENDLLTEKGSHKKTLAAIAALYVQAGIDTKSQGAQIALGLAAGLLSEVKAVESAAQTLAKAVAKYIKIGSPAEAGPFHDQAPEAMGKALTASWWKGIVGGFAGLDLGPALARVAGGLALPSMALTGAGTGGPIAPGATAAAVPGLAAGGDMHITVDLGEKFSQLFGTNRYFDTISQGLALRRRS